MHPDRVPYSQCAIVGDMLSAVEVVRTFDPHVVEPLVEPVRKAGKLLFTGEGSSRLFPAKSAIAHCLRMGRPLEVHTEAGLQAKEYRLDDWAVLALSNSGRTAEVIRLFAALKEAGHPQRFSVAAQTRSPLEEYADWGYVLRCGQEGAVAATKSVIEQALFCRALVEAVAGRSTLSARLPALADAMHQALTVSIDRELVDKLAATDTIYFAGRNDGVAEELTLKTNEIARQRSDFLEGTYAVHGIEEVMRPDDVLVWIDPYPESRVKFHDALVKGVGLTIIAVSHRPTMFATVQIPDAGDLNGFVQLAAGWNLLVEIGLARGVNLDRPQRARKVGNEYVA